MPMRREAPNVGVEHGAWGEDVAVEYLRIHGYEIVDRNVHPCRRDRRLEIDVIAYDRMFDVMAFVEVKQHARRSPYARRLQSVTRHKKDLLRRACRTWLLAYAGRDRPHPRRSAVREERAVRPLGRLKMKGKQP